MTHREKLERKAAHNLVFQAYLLAQVQNELVLVSALGVSTRKGVQLAELHDFFFELDLQLALNPLEPDFDFQVFLEQFLFFNGHILTSGKSCVKSLSVAQRFLE